MEDGSRWAGRLSWTWDACSMVLRTAGAGLRRLAEVAVMQATDFGGRHDPARLGELDGPDVRRILVERKMRASPVIVGEVAGQDAAQVAFAENQNVIQTLAPDRSVRHAKRRPLYLSPRVSRSLVQAYLAKSALPADPLTPRERGVLQFVAEGKTTKEVAQLLGISAKTVESHRTRIMKKLDTPNIAGVVRYAIRLGLIEV